MCIRDRPLPCAYTGSPAETAAFQLGPGVRVRLSIKEYLQAVVLPVHLHTAPVELPAGKLPLRLFGELLDVYKRQQIGLVAFELLHNGVDFPLLFVKPRQDHGRQCFVCEGHI